MFATHYAVSLNEATTCDIVVHSLHYGVSARGRHHSATVDIDGPWAQATRREAAEVLRMARRYGWPVHVNRF